MVAKIVLETIPYWVVGSIPTNLIMNKVKKDFHFRSNYKNYYPESLLSTILSNNKILPLKTRQN